MKNIDKDNNLDFDPMKVAVNDFIVEVYEEFLINNDLLKEIRAEKKEELNNDDDILEITNKLDEYKQKILPLREKLKVAKENFKKKNINLFQKENDLKQNVLKLKYKLAKAYAYKEYINDKTPILINNWKKELIINLKPEIKKQKI